MISIQYLSVCSLTLHPPPEGCSFRFLKGNSKRRKKEKKEAEENQGIH
jgi:hypothetical protein